MNFEMPFFFCRSHPLAAWLLLLYEAALDMLRFSGGKHGMFDAARV